jgi:hypothetical protein
MLSSLLDQIQMNGTEIVVAVASLKDNGNPTTEELVSYFNSRGLKVKHTVYEDRERFDYRGLIRNDQIKELDEDTDWVLFADCDMVYDQMFFCELKEKLEAQPKEPALYSTVRWSTHKETTNNFFTDAMLRYPEHILGCHNYMDKVFSPLKRMRSVGAGYFQLVKREYITTYVNEKKNRDKKMSKSFNPKSDMQFRRSIDNTVTINMEAKQYHLNHDRDPDKGDHNQEQR